MDNYQTYLLTEVVLQMIKQFSVMSILIFTRAYVILDSIKDSVINVLHILSYFKVTVKVMRVYTVLVSVDRTLETSRTLMKS